MNEKKGVVLNVFTEFKNEFINFGNSILNQRRNEITYTLQQVENLKSEFLYRNQTSITENNRIHSQEIQKLQSTINELETQNMGLRHELNIQSRKNVESELGFKQQIQQFESKYHMQEVLLNQVKQQLEKSEENVKLVTEDHQARIQELKRVHQIEVFYTKRFRNLWMFG